MRSSDITDPNPNPARPRLWDWELGPIINRDLTRRIRTVNGITVDKRVVRNDIKLAAKVITNLDQRWGLWQKKKNKAAEDTNGDGSSEEKKDTEFEEKADDSNLGITSTNPVLNNITDYLVSISSDPETIFMA